jgi:hypothetical protein
MDLKELEKAQRLYARIKELDAEIISIERLALLASTKKTSIKLSLTIEDLEKVKDSEKTIIDCDGSLSLGHDSLGVFKFFMPSFPGTPKKAQEHDGSLESDLTDSVCLGVLDVLLQSKIEARELAIKSLNRMGVKV